MVTASMENQLILIADNDAKNLEILRENLEASGFLVSAVSNGKDAWEEIVRTKPRLILTEINLPGLSGFQLLERMKNDPENAATPTIFLTKQRDVQQRLRAFELGVKDYLVKPLHVKEVIAHIRMILRRLKKFDADAADMQNQFSGKLEQLSLADLIESFGVERKTGILTLSNGRRSGQVFFREGAVINARLGDFKMEQALYQMFPWKKGFFKMIFQEVDVAEEISISNLGLLLQGLKRLELREKLIRKLPSPEATFVTTAVFRQLLQKKKLDNGVNDFTRLLDGKHTVEQIIDESNLEDLVALKRLVRLYQQGFIKSIPQKEAREPETEKVFAGGVESEFAEHLAAHPPVQPVESDVRLDHNGKDNNFEEAKPIFPGIEEDTKIEIPQPSIAREESSPPTLEMRQERKEVLEPTKQEPEGKTAEPEEIDTNKSLFEEVFPENGKDAHADEAEKIEPSVAKSPEPENFPDQSAEMADEEERDNSILAGENIEDYIFEVTPRRPERDLEEEIKPLITEIEKNSKAETPAKAEIDQEKHETAEGEPVELPPDFSMTEEVDSGATDSELQDTFVDEALLRKVADSQQQAQNRQQEQTTTAQPTQPEQKEKEPARLGSGDKVVLISVDEDCKDSVMDILTHDNFKTLKVPGMPDFSIDVGKIKLAEDKEVKLISVPIEKQLNTFLDSIKDSTLGCLFTFDCSRQETWEYTSYLIHSISDKFKTPFAVLVMNLDEHESLTLDVVRYKLALSAEDTLLQCEETDENCVNQLLYLMNNFV